MDIDGFRLHRCPLRPMLDEPELMNEVFEAWRWREKGYLPEDGTWKDQPAKLPHLLAVVDRAIEEAQEAKHKRDAARRSRSGSGGVKPKPGRSAIARPRPRPRR